MKEVWKNIEGFEGLYQVSNWGRVRTLDRITIDKIGRKRFVKGIIRRLKITKNGYHFINLSKNNELITYRINRLEAITFELPIPEELKHIPIEELDVEHIDANKENNQLENLRWATHKGNMENPITRQRMSESHKGEKNNFYGKHHTEESKRKMNKPVLQLDKSNDEIIKEWSSATEVERQLGYNQGHISKCCKDKRKTAYGFKWSFK